MDEVDMTQAREVPVQQSTKPRPEGPKPKGECCYCGARMGLGRFCDAQCRDDFQYLESRK